MLQRAVGAAVAAALLFGVALIPVALWPDCRAAPWKCLRPGSGRALTTEAPSSPCTTSPHAPPNRRLSSPVDFIVRLWGQTYPMTAVWNETVHRYLGHAHAETQESLFQDLKQVWGAQTLTTRNNTQGQAYRAQPLPPKTPPLQPERSPGPTAISQNYISSSQHRPFRIKGCM